MFYPQTPPTHTHNPSFYTWSAMLDVIVLLRLCLLCIIQALLWWMVFPLYFLSQLYGKVNSLCMTEAFLWWWSSKGWNCLQILPDFWCQVDCVSLLAIIFHLCTSASGKANVMFAMYLLLWSLSNTDYLLILINICRPWMRPLFNAWRVAIRIKILFGDLFAYNMQMSWNCSVI